MKPLSLTQNVSKHLYRINQKKGANGLSLPSLVILLTLALSTSIVTVRLNALSLEQEPVKAPPIQQAKILDEANYNPTWFTQGLYQEAGNTYISSGLYGRSAIIKQSKIPTPRQQRYRLNSRYFAEGLTLIDNTLYLLTWKENTLLMFDKHSLKPIGKKEYKGEGWGLTHRPKTHTQDTEFIMSNGSDTLTFRDKETFKVTRQLTVKGLNLINELEYVNGIIWANRWYDNHLYGIDSESGHILAKVDLLPLRKKATTISNKNVVNGISYDKGKKALWVTGKYWNKRFLIEMPNIQEQ